MAIHEYHPTIYHSTLGHHEPVLRIADGDTVVTKTVDNAGRNEFDDNVTSGVNPQTGPFYIEGAEPGDTLAVRFDSLSPNRVIGRSSTVIAYNVMDPYYIREVEVERFEAEWRLDVNSWTAILVKPETKLGDFSLPLSPMLGCFGVAPSQGQAMSAETSANHGGNMDYRGFTAGVTVYFPVFAKGALLFMGDGHAVQGDGEISGTGIEVSFDVKFTVKVLKGKRINWLRAENDGYIMTVGNARPLDQALQHATTEMMRWLREDYGLEHHDISILLGQCVEYDVGNVFDPAYTMVCKLKKEFLGES